MSEQGKMREELDVATLCVTRLLAWLRGEDPEFSKLIVELRDSRKSKTSQESRE